MSKEQLAITFGSGMVGRVPNIPNAHGYGFVVVEGDSYAEARTMAYTLTDGIYSFDYPMDQILEQVPKYGLVRLGVIRDGIYYEGE
jgi:hypothetical protein